jgi:hypothetical protein
MGILTRKGGFRRTVLAVSAKEGTPVQVVAAPVELKKFSAMRVWWEVAGLLRWPSWEKMARAEAEKLH